MKVRESFALIDNQDSMNAAMEGLASESLIALDFEMENNFHHYGLHIALVQLSTPSGSTFVFDPLSGIDMQPIGSLLVSPRVELVIHDVDFDKRACRQVYGWKLRNFFDTRIAAQFCGFRQYGLAVLLRELLGVETDKKFQRIDWLKRPLSPEALNYAARETGYLFPLRAILIERLERLGRLTWVREECRRIEHLVEPDEQVPAHYKMKGSTSLEPRALAILGALADFRDGLARELGRPAHFVIPNKTLIGMAECPPGDVAELKRTHRIHPSLRKLSNAKRLLSAVKRGLEGPEEIHPRRVREPRSSPGYSGRLKAMQAWRAHRASELDMEPYLLLSNDILSWFAKHPVKELPEDREAQIRNWQKDLIWDDFRKQFS